MKKDVTTVPTLKAINITITTLCTVDAKTKTKITCSLAKDTLKGSKDGTTYKFITTNACSEDEDAEITIKVTHTSSFLSVSKYAFVLIDYSSFKYHNTLINKIFL